MSLWSSISMDKCTLMWTVGTSCIIFNNNHGPKDSSFLDHKHATAVYALRVNEQMGSSSSKFLYTKLHRPSQRNVYISVNFSRWLKSSNEVTTKVIQTNLPNLIHKGQCLSVCVSVCLFSIEIQTAGRIGTKFGTEVVLEGGGRFLSLNTFFNTYFESSRATPGNPS